MRNLLEQRDDAMAARETVGRREELRLQAAESEVLHLSPLNFYVCATVPFYTLLK